MKYGFKGESLSVLIENYQVNGDYIIINYLDGSSKWIDYNEENEKMLINTMINQAIIRRNVMPSSLKKMENSSLIKVLFLNLIAAGLDARVWIEDDFDSYLKLIPYTFMLVCSFISGVTLKEIVDNKKLIEELTKYETYLSIREKLLKYKDAEGLYDGINFVGDININTIDLYSAKDLEKLKNNLLGIKERQI